MTNRVTLNNGDVFATGDITSKKAVKGTTFEVSSVGAVQGSIKVGTSLDVTGSSYYLLIDNYTNGELPSVLMPGHAHNLGELTDDVDLSDVSFLGGQNRAMTCEIWFSTGYEPHKLTLPDGIYIGATKSYLDTPRANSHTRVALRKEGQAGDLILSIAYEYPVQS